MDAPRPRLILWVAAAMLVGAVSMGFNPLFLPSALAIGAGVVAIREAQALRPPTPRGILTGLAVIGLVAGLGGIAIAVRVLSASPALP